MSVGSEVLVTHTTRDLEVLIEAGDHQKLLQLLRRLRQRIAHAWVKARGDQIIARPLRRALHQHGGFDLIEAARIQEISHKLHDPMAKGQNMLHAFPSEIEVAILEAERLVLAAITADQERWQLGAVEQPGVMDLHLDGAGGKVGVGHARGACLHASGHLQHVLATGLIERRACLGVRRGIGYQLRDAVAVAQIDKQHRSVVAATMHPPRQRHLQAAMLAAELSTGMGSKHAIPSVRILHLSDCSSKTLMPDSELWPIEARCSATFFTRSEWCMA